MHPADPDNGFFAPYIEISMEAYSRDSDGAGTPEPTYILQHIVPTVHREFVAIGGQVDDEAARVAVAQRLRFRGQTLTLGAWIYRANQNVGARPIVQEVQLVRDSPGADGARAEVRRTNKRVNFTPFVADTWYPSREHVRIQQPEFNVLLPAQERRVGAVWGLSFGFEITPSVRSGTVRIAVPQLGFGPQVLPLKPRLNYDGRPAVVNRWEHKIVMLGSGGTEVGLPRCLIDRVIAQPLYEEGMPESIRISVRIGDGRYHLIGELERREGEYQLATVEGWPYALERPAVLRLEWRPPEASEYTVQIAIRYTRPIVG